MVTHMGWVYVFKVMQSHHYNCTCVARFSATAEFLVIAYVTANHTDFVLYLLCHRTRSTNTIEHRTQEKMKKKNKNNSKKNKNKNKKQKKNSKVK